VRGLELLEGERVHRVLRMHPLCMIGAYGTVLGLLGWTLLLALLALGPGPAFASDLDRGTGPFALVVLLMLWWAGLAAATVPFALRAARLWPVAYAVAVAVLGGLGLIVATAPGPGAAQAVGWLPWLTLAAVPLPLAVAEVRRRGSAWVLTNLRVVHVHGWLHPHEESTRLPRIERATAEPRGMRGLDLGDVLLARKDGEPLRIIGVRPLARTRDDIEMLLHTAPTPSYVGDQRDAADRVRDLLRPGE
jgi:hypothetical protein